jgi:thioredoxin 1
MTVYTLKNSNDLNTFLAKQPVSVIKVYADWCGPCKTYAPKYEALAHRYNNNSSINFASTNSDDKVVKATALPTTLIVKNGKIIHSMTGGDVNELERALSTLSR